MAMRMPRIFRESTPVLAGSPEWNPPGPRPVRAPATIVPWPGSESERAGDEELVTRARAQIRVKRFAGHSGFDEERFGATVEALGNSPAALLQELARIVEKDADLNRSAPNGEPFIFEVRLSLG